MPLFSQRGLLTSLGVDILDPTTQTAVASVITASIATSGVVVAALINNRKERSKAADAGVEAGVDAGLSDQDVLKLVADLISENARKEANIVKLTEEKRLLEEELASRKGEDTNDGTPTHSGTKTGSGKRRPRS